MLEKTQSGAFDVRHLDGRVVRLHIMWSFKDGKIAMSSPVNNQAKYTELINNDVLRHGDIASPFSSKHTAKQVAPPRILASSG